jgi:hypothetical protein
MHEGKFLTYICLAPYVHQRTLLWVNQAKVIGIIRHGDQKASSQMVRIAIATSRCSPRSNVVPADGNPCVEDLFR